MFDRLHSHLAAFSALTAIATGGVWQVEKPQKATYPLLLFYEASTLDVQSHSGVSNLKNSRVTFEGWAYTLPVARSIVTQVLAALRTFDPTLPEDESPPTVVNADRFTILGRRSDVWNEPAPKVYRASVDVRVWWKE